MFVVIKNALIQALFHLTMSYCSLKHVCYGKFPFLAFPIVCTERQLDLYMPEFGRFHIHKQVKVNLTEQPPTEDNSTDWAQLPFLEDM